MTIVALVLSLVWMPLPGIVLAGLGVEFVMRELDAHVPATHTVAFAGGLLLVCELMAWSDALRSRALIAPVVVRRRLGNVAGAIAVGAAASALTLAAGDVESPNAFLAGVGGAIAIVAVVGVVWSLGRRTA